MIRVTVCIQLPAGRSTVELYRETIYHQDGRLEIHLDKNTGHRITEGHVSDDLVQKIRERVCIGHVYGHIDNCVWTTREM